MDPVAFDALLKSRSASNDKQDRCRSRPGCLGVSFAMLVFREMSRCDALHLDDRFT